MKNYRKNESGVVLLFSIILISIMLGVGLTLSSIFIGKLKASIDAKSSIGAYYAADSGIEWKLYETRVATETFSTILNIGSEFEIEEGDGYIRSLGTYRGVSRAIEVIDYEEVGPTPTPEIEVSPTPTSEVTVTPPPPPACRDTVVGWDEVDRWTRKFEIKGIGEAPLNCCHCRYRIFIDYDPRHQCIVDGVDVGRPGGCDRYDSGDVCVIMNQRDDRTCYGYDLTSSDESMCEADSVHCR